MSKSSASSLLLTLVVTSLAVKASAQFTLVETGGTFRTDATNLASSGTAFSSGEIGVAPHSTAGLNNGSYGNSSSWIGNGAGSSAGILLNSGSTLSSFAFGRDNTGVYGDRSAGAYTFYYTTQAGLTTGNALSATWISLGTVTYPGASNQPARRNLFNLNTAVTGATGFRIAAPSGAAIDEIELYSTSASLPTTQGASTLGSLTGGTTTRSSGQRLGQSFTTSGYTTQFRLDEVSLGMSAGTYSNFTVTLHANGSNNQPGTVLATLAGPSTYAGTQPTFTASEVLLDPSTTYWVTWGFTGTGDYQMSVAGAPEGLWVVGDRYVGSSDNGASWFVSSPGNYYAISISGSAVSAIPEPSTYAVLAGLGALGLALWRRRKTRA
jgi:hypothetical protein